MFSLDTFLDKGFNLCYFYKKNIFSFADDKNILKVFLSNDIMGCFCSLSTNCG